MFRKHNDFIIAPDFENGVNASMKTNNSQKKSDNILGIPYDFDKPTIARTKSRYWNGTDQRLFTPKVYGAGWTINFYWLCHPISYVTNKHNK
jgi:hypothetical protein